MNDPCVSEFYTMGELITALDCMGVTLERPTCTPAGLVLFSLLSCAALTLFFARA
jgi:hypothetical protein